MKLRDYLRKLLAMNFMFSKTGGGMDFTTDELIFICDAISRRVVDLNFVNQSGGCESIKVCLGKNKIANLARAKNIKFPIISISGSKHLFYYHNKKIKIGCEEHTVLKWLNNYESIGRAHNYTDEEINEYFGYIKMCEVYSK